MLDQITPVILTKDEEANIGRTLTRLAWAPEVVIVDSGSTDTTLDIARQFPNVRILERELDTLAGQSNFGIRHVHTPWVLLLDADYFVPPEFVEELRTLAPPPNVRAYRAAFSYAVNGRPLRASLYPARIVLLHREHSHVWQDGHAHRVLADGDVETLQTKIIHDDRKSFARFVERQKKYMRQEAEKLRTADPRALSVAGRVRKLIVVAPVAVVFHTLFVKGLILDGVAGLRYTWERFVAELILSRELLRKRVGSSGRP
ncbi:MAG TPA: glycosyltransferase family 2 protein [Thermoanaerobaculia bacterium]|nr:glycosyltransferase family 2 protein [Thermoanaerobaculia bacterium]